MIDPTTSFGLGQIALHWSAFLGGRHCVRCTVQSEARFCRSFFPWRVPSACSGFACQKHQHLVSSPELLLSCSCVCSFLFVARERRVSLGKNCYGIKRCSQPGTAACRDCTVWSRGLCSRLVSPCSLYHEKAMIGDARLHGLQAYASRWIISTTVFWPKQVTG